MIRELLAQSPMLAVPLGTLFLFLGVFVGALALTYGRRAAAFDPVARLPLADDGAGRAGPGEDEDEDEDEDEEDAS
jgi:hypothetical protein